MNKKNISRSQSDWKALIDAWLQSGKEIETFCQEQKIATSGFYIWRKRLYPEMARKTIKSKLRSSVFVPIALAEENAPAALILTYPNGCQLKISGVIDPNILRMLNQGMGLPSC